MMFAINEPLWSSERLLMHPVILPLCGFCTPGEECFRVCPSPAVSPFSICLFHLSNFPAIVPGYISNDYI